MRALAISGISVNTGTPNRRAHQTGDHIDIVDHQIQHDIDIRAALDERRQAVALDKFRILDHAFKTANRRIKPFEMADLKQRPLGRRQRDQFLGLGQIRGQRFFDQDIDAGVKKVTRDSMMITGRHRNAGATNSADELVVVGKRRRPQRLADRPGALAVDIDYADQVGLFRRRVLLGVKLAEITDTDHRDG
jgi:hypothetical protein